MKKIHILSGPAGVGKSTFINDNKSTNDIIISSDVIQKELHGELAPLGNKGDVFEEMFSRLKMAIKSNSDADIYYDATNLGRKRRMNIYNHIKSWIQKGNMKWLLMYYINRMTRLLNKIVNGKVENLYLSLKY